MPAVRGVLCANVCVWQRGLKVAQGNAAGLGVHCKAFQLSATKIHFISIIHNSCSKCYQTCQPVEIPVLAQAGNLQIHSENTCICVVFGNVFSSYLTRCLPLSFTLWPGHVCDHLHARPAQLPAFRSCHCVMAPLTSSLSRWFYVCVFFSLCIYVNSIYKHTHVSVCVYIYIFTSSSFSWIKSNKEHWHNNSRINISTTD